MPFSSTAVLFCMTSLCTCKPIYSQYYRLSTSGCRHWTDQVKESHRGEIILFNSESECGKLKYKKLNIVRHINKNTKQHKYYMNIK